MITSDSPDRPYSTRLRTALVLTGTGTAGAYHAGVLRALHEAGVRVDLVAGRGIGAVGAMFAAVDGGQRLVESRISMLQMRVSQIQLMNLDRIPHGKVGFGSTVTLHDEAGQTVVYSLVMPEDANVEEGMISTASPIGRALLNKEEGDDIIVTRPDGTERRFELVKLVTIHDT